MYIYILIRIINVILFHICTIYSGFCPDFRVGNDIHVLKQLIITLSVN